MMMIIMITNIWLSFILLPSLHDCLLDFEHAPIATHVLLNSTLLTLLVTITGVFVVLVIGVIAASHLTFAFLSFCHNLWSLQEYR